MNRAGMQDTIEKLGYSKEKAKKITDTICDTFKVGDGKKKENLIVTLKEKLDIGGEEANKIYDQVTKFLADNVVDKVKGFFKK